MSRIRMSRFFCVAVLAAAVCFPAYPLAGIGAHFGIDMSLSMEDALKEQASLSDLSLDITSFGGTVPTGYTKTALTGADLPVYISRTDWQRNWFNLGGKVFIDIIPFLNTVELSVNYGMWEYQGKVIYPTSITFTAPTANNNQNINDIATVNYDTTMITSEALGLGNPFIENTPYAKLQFDVTSRKTIASFPPIIKIIKIYAGGGLSLSFATPVLSAAFIEKTLGSTLSAVNDVNNLQGSLFGQNNDAMVKIGKQFMKDLMTPHMGMHLDLGASLKLPVMPVGVFIDLNTLSRSETWTRTSPD